MASYFLDTSALVRRYVQSEPGAARVAAICRPANGHRILITRLTPVEVASALTRHRRRGNLDDEGVRRHWRLFRRHAAHRYRVVDLDVLMLEQGANLVLVHGLRAYDAVQLAAALHVRSAGGLMLNFRFCTADANQAEAADREGLAVELIA